MQMQMHSDEQPCGGRANTYRMEMCNCIGANNYAKKGGRNNRARDADAIAHGMRNRMGAGPAPAAWGGAPASGQGQQLCQKRHIDTIVLGMQMQLRMGCATRWGQSAWDVQRHSGRAKNMPTAGSRCNCAPDVDAIAHGMSNWVGVGPIPTAW